MQCCVLLLAVCIDLKPVVSFLLIRADKGKDQSLFLQLEMVEGTTIVVLTMDTQTVSLLLLFLESVEMVASLDMPRGVHQ